MFEGKIHKTLFPEKLGFIKGKPGYIP